MTANGAALESMVAITDMRTSSRRRSAEEWLRRRIDRSELRFVKRRFGLADSDRLADHFTVVVLVRTFVSHGRPVRAIQWGVSINGIPAGYLALTHGGTRYKFLPKGFGPGRVDVADPLAEDVRRTLRATMAV
jgi:hypothetical protein